jgi:hypothetical protein
MPYRFPLIIALLSLLGVLGIAAYLRTSAQTIQETKEVAASTPETASPTPSAAPLAKAATVTSEEVTNALGASIEQELTDATTLPIDLNDSELDALLSAPITVQ